LKRGIAAELILQAASKVELEVVYVDSPDPVPERFERILASMVGGEVKVVAENSADAKYAIVGAASIIAKTERDRIVEELKRRYGDFGSGYPSDPEDKGVRGEVAERARASHRPSLESRGALGAR